MTRYGQRGHGNCLEKWGTSGGGLQRQLIVSSQGLTYVAEKSKGQVCLLLAFRWVCGCTRGRDPARGSMVMSFVAGDTEDGPFSVLLARHDCIGGAALAGTAR